MDPPSSARAFIVTPLPTYLGTWVRTRSSLLVVTHPGVLPPPLAMASTRVLRLSRSDESGFILLHVSNTGPAPLDLTLAATEGECPYTTKGRSCADSSLVSIPTDPWPVKQSSLKDLRFKNYQGSDEEWSHIVSFVLGQSAPTDESTSLSGIEASTSIEGSGEENKKAVITIRKRVQAITVWSLSETASILVPDYVPAKTWFHRPEARR